MPINDLREHDESSACACCPRYDEAADMIVHNAFDGREFLEQAIAADDFENSTRGFALYASHVNRLPDLNEHAACAMIERGLALVYRAWRIKDFTVFVHAENDN